MTVITEWIVAHDPGAEPPPFCEHCGKILEAHYVEENGIRRWRNEVHTFNCPEGHYPHQEHIYCLECKKEVFGEIHDLLTEFLVYDPETGRNVKGPFTHPPVIFDDWEEQSDPCAACEIYMKQICGGDPDTCGRGRNQ